MSTQSTPRSTRSARSASAMGSPAQMLTPSRKVKAILAAFDSDSETESTTNANTKFTTNVSKMKLAPVVAQDEDEDDEDDDIISFAPKGRMASRMQGLQNSELSRSEPAQQPETAYERVTRRLREPSSDIIPMDVELTNGDQPSNDNIPNVTRSEQPQLDDMAVLPEEVETSNRNSERSESPLFVENDSYEILGSDNTIQADEPKNARFLALVQQKRKEREERERIELEKKAARVEKQKKFNSDITLGEDSDEDTENAQNEIFKSRPTRKASKKALEEMNRETQRLSRNRQLTHQPQVKRKLTVEDFVTQMTAKWQARTSTQASNNISSSTSSVPTQLSNNEKNKEIETPPISLIETSSDDQLNVQVSEPSEKVVRSDSTSTKKVPKKFNIQLSREEISRRQREEPDDDLIIITSPGKCHLLEAFENVGSRRSHENEPMLKLKMLARLTSPTRRSKSMNHAELNTMLRLKARQQALQEKYERIEELRARGIVIETAEEREAMEADVEDIMEKARKEADEIARREKAAREKKSGVESGSDDEDEEYMLSGSEDEEENQEGDEVDIEGSDEEEEEEEDEEEEISDKSLRNLVENEADVSVESEDEESEVANQESKQDDVTRNVRRRRLMRVLSEDEEDEEAAEEKGQATASKEIKTPARSTHSSGNSAQRPMFPNVPETSSFTMNLSQAFAGTIAENQYDAGEDSQQVIPSLPDPGLPNFQQTNVDSHVLVKDSQEPRPGLVDLLSRQTQSDSRVSESPDPYWSQQSQIPEPTQDIGFVYTPLDPSKRYLDPPVSTIDTVVLSNKESPSRSRKGRLQRGRPTVLSDDEDGDFEMKASAFDVMKKAAAHKTKSTVLFDKSNSKAKEHIDEAAEESEDEYAGLGGASDDDDGEENEIDKEIINDNSGEIVDEKELAALNANHQRDMDEKQVSKLLKDITTGALRRRHGAHDDLDLDDSDDERIARRKAKQREFAKMRKALLADEKISEIASNPKKVAFFKALEDRDDEEMDFEFENVVDSLEVSSQDIQKETQSAATNTENLSKKRKQPLEPAAADVYNRPPPHLRRTAADISRKPSTLAEIQETLSFLTKTPEYDSFHEDIASIENEISHNTDVRNSETENNAEHDQGTSAKGFSIPPNPRRTRGPVINRLALKRDASSNSTVGNNKPAFMTESSSWDSLRRIGFHPPALHRSATSSWSTSIDSSSLSTTNITKSTSVHRPPVVNKPKASVNYYTAARERERERELKLKDHRKNMSVAKLARMRNKSLTSGLRALKQGEFSD